MRGWCRRQCRCRQAARPTDGTPPRGEPLSGSYLQTPEGRCEHPNANLPRHGPPAHQNRRSRRQSHVCKIERRYVSDLQSGPLAMIFETPAQGPKNPQPCHRPPRPAPIEARPRRPAACSRAATAVTGLHGRPPFESLIGSVRDALGRHRCAGFSCGFERGEPDEGRPDPQARWTHGRECEDRFQPVPALTTARCAGVAFRAVVLSRCDR